MAVVLFGSGAAHAPNAQKLGSVFLYCMSTRKYFIIIEFSLPAYTLTNLAYCLGVQGV